MLSALSDQKAYRSLLSPAEALNIVTVGAMHDDAVTGPRGVGGVDPVRSARASQRELRAGTWPP